MSYSKKIEHKPYKLNVETILKKDRKTLQDLGNVMHEIDGTYAPKSVYNTFSGKSQHEPNFKTLELARRALQVLLGKQMTFEDLIEFQDLPMSCLCVFPLGYPVVIEGIDQATPTQGSGNKVGLTGKGRKWLPYFSNYSSIIETLKENLSSQQSEEIKSDKEPKGRYNALTLTFEERSAIIFHLYQQSGQAQEGIKFFDEHLKNSNKIEPNIGFFTKICEADCHRMLGNLTECETIIDDVIAKLSKDIWSEKLTPNWMNAYTLNRLRARALRAKGVMQRYRGANYVDSLLTFDASLECFRTIDEEMRQLEARKDIKSRRMYEQRKSYLHTTAHHLEEAYVRLAYANLLTDNAELTRSLIEHAHCLKWFLHYGDSRGLNYVKLGVVRLKRKMREEGIESLVTSNLAAYLQDMQKDEISASSSLFDESVQSTLLSLFNDDVRSTLEDALSGFTLLGERLGVAYANYLLLKNLGAREFADIFEGGPEGDKSRSRRSKTEFVEREDLKAVKDLMEAFSALGDIRMQGYMYLEMAKIIEEKSVKGFEECEEYLKSAEDVFVKGNKEKPEEPHFDQRGLNAARLKLGRYLLLTGKFDESQKAFNHCIATQNQTINALDDAPLLAIVYQQLAECKLLQESLKIIRKDSSSLEEERYLEIRGLYLSSLRLSDLLDSDSGRFYAYMGLATLNLSYKSDHEINALSRLRAAKTLISPRGKQQTIPQQKRDADFQYAMARLHIKTKEYDEAIRLFKEALEVYERNNTMAYLHAKAQAYLYLALIRGLKVVAHQSKSKEEIDKLEKEFDSDISNSKQAYEKLEHKPGVAAVKALQKRFNGKSISE